MFFANAYAEGNATTASGVNVNASATASATSDISQEDATIKAVNLAQSIADSIAQNNANIENQSVVVVNTPSTNPNTITLYYKLNVENSVVTNATLLTFIPYIGSSSPYSGLENLYMTDSNWNPNQDIITFIGYRTPGNDALQLPPLYCETVIIKTAHGDFISGLANYVDNGSSFVTTTAFENYAVTCASGIFSGYKNIQIVFNNVNNTRVVHITN